jgi:hypothetical protein
MLLSHLLLLICLWLKKALLSPVEENLVSWRDGYFSFVFFILLF